MNSYRRLNPGIGDMDLMLAFSESVLTQSRALVKAVMAQAEDELLGLATRRNDRFLTLHVHDVLRELQSASRSIQLSFCNELSKSFIAFMHQDRAWADSRPAGCADALDEGSALALRRCQSNLAPRLRELASRIRAPDSASPSPAADVPLLIGPEDIAFAFMHAVNSIHLPMHAEVRHCLANLMAHELAGRATAIYEQFVLFLDSPCRPARGSILSTTDTSSVAELLRALEDRGDAATAPVAAGIAAASSGSTAAPISRSPSAPRPEWLDGASRRVSLPGGVAAGEFSSGNSAPMTHEGALAEPEDLDSDDLQPRSLFPYETLQRIRYTGTVFLVTTLYLATSVLVLAFIPGRQAVAPPVSVGESTILTAPVGAPPALRPANETTTTDRIAASGGESDRDEHLPLPTLADSDDSPRPGEPADTPRASPPVQEPAPAVAAPDAPPGDNATIAARGKIQVKGYHWERSRADKTIRFWVR
ncbi:MAG: hypothetical protein H6R26_1777, partial [Proteobacteria bacterium]|nr:hypothetical protein [Pseudomonadota bacterium]